MLGGEAMLSKFRHDVGIKSFALVVACMNHFTETSSDPYDRHHYRVWLGDGSFQDVESYDDAQRIWYSSTKRPKTIEVTQPRITRGAKGF